MRQSVEELEMINRADDVSYVMDCVAGADCCSIVGVSNIGKSMLLRSLPDLCEEYLDTAADRYTFVYVDFNLMSQMTEQGFYEVILRNWLEALAERRADAGLHSAIRQAYQTVIAPDSPFHVPLAFEDSLKAFREGQSGMLVLLFDEFDEVLAELDPRVFVRLRAMKDRHWFLCYVTATNRRLPQIRSDRQVGEFCELFAAHTRHLAPLGRTDARALVQRCAEQSDLQLAAQDIDFLLDCADGHPALLQAACRSFGREKEELSWRGSAADYAKLCDHLSGDADVRLECAKLWNDLGMQEQEVVIRLLAGEDVTSELDTLIEKGIVHTSAAGRQVFGELFAGFVRRQQLVRRREPRGVRVDVEAGDVWVDGELAPTLTELEYKLLLLLYGNLDKICDKYTIVESVWGEGYIDEVDDARIEKLVSRLRQKIEPEPEDPRYLITIRGRGYKLVGPQ
jgi:hypothetical protein